ncbi:pyridoxal phosphate-dependent transferase [Sordaria brevicollis]|uniref:Pyridoxal phosphate-dependent transferase n=1 Tax=Sordaria brevicollis TaxID=83679 RepID=A0AAE0PAW2_SORBR|nr:pyridoxal phosphate-dependent transferase [Sordaria brevicollis]
MTVNPITTPLGYSLPPHTPHAITVHLPGWDTALRLRDGDPELGKQLKSMYPRFSPLSLVKEISNPFRTPRQRWLTKRQLCTKLLTILPSVSPTTHGCLPFTTPDSFPLATAHAISHHRPAEHRFSEADLSSLQFKVVDFLSVPLIPDAEPTENVRLYLVIYPLPETKGVMGVWTNPGIGISTRLAEVLVPLVDDAGRVEVLEWEATGTDFLAGPGTLKEQGVPKPTYLPESDAHTKLRERIVALCQRSPLDAEVAAKLKPEDVFLYTTGMAAVFRLQEALLKAGRQGTVVALGAVFHSTFHLFEELEEATTSDKEEEEKVEAFKHFGNCEDSAKVMDELEQYARELKEKGRKIAYLFVEFPSNPLLVSVDLERLRKIADEYNFPVVVDDTVGSFANIDVLPVADVVVTSLTKTFSGFADVMAGSILLSPSSRYHPLLSSVLLTSHSNNLSPPDAIHLLSNSNSYLSRSATHNHNAEQLATFLHTYSLSHPHVISRVLYPTTLPSLPNYTRHMRPATPEFTPGYGCLLSINFPTKRIARAFYDNLQVHQGPHLGAHLTIALPFNDLLWGAEEGTRKYHGGYGSVGSQVRVSVGLEGWEGLREAFQYALDEAEKVVREGAEETK